MLGNELLQGEKVRLTALTVEDAPIVAEWQQDAVYRRLLQGGLVTPSSVDDVESWFSEIHKGQGDYFFGIQTLADAQLIGMVSIKDINHTSRTCGFWIGIGERSVWGQGYGTDALVVLLRYIFWEMNMNRVDLDVLSYNERAKAMYEKVGFVHEATVREAAWRDGVYYDVYKMGMLYSEWKPRYGS